MLQLELTERIAPNTDWASFAFLLLVIMITLSKVLFRSKFNTFSKLLISNKYFNKYAENPKINIWFDSFLMVNQMVSYSFFILLILDYIGLSHKHNYHQFFIVLMCLIGLKIGLYLIGHFIAFIFELTQKFAFFHFQKNSYKNLISIYFIPINLILFYNDLASPIVLYLLLALFVLLNISGFLNSIKSQLQAGLSSIFYFFLYLCTLEIAPYIIVCYWFIKLNNNYSL